MERKIIAYRNVFNRDDAREFSINDLLLYPEIIAHSFGIYDYEQYCIAIKEITDKSERNEAKKVFFPACDLSQSGVLSIDIDNINNNTTIKGDILKKLSDLESCFAVQESASGNLVAFFKYDCPVKMFPFLYYKIYLELTLLLKVNIDFLPEIGRLRYASNGAVKHLNEESETLTEVLDVEVLPKINTYVTTGQARRTIYKSE